MPARILIVTSGNPCNNPRPLKEAWTLGRAGYDVTLLGFTAGPTYDALDRTLTAGAPFRHESVPEPRSFFIRAGQWLARRAVPFGLETVYALGAPGALLRRARTHAADLIIVHNEVPHWIGTRLLRAGRRVAADVEDWHAEDLLPDARRHRPLRLLRQIEACLLRDAVYTTTTSAVLANALHSTYGGRRPGVITNAFPLQPDYRRESTAETPVFFWFSQTVGPGRGLEAFFDAWALTRQSSRVVLLGDPVLGYVETTLNRLPPAWRTRVQFRPRVAPADLPAVIAEHDIGLALEVSSIASRDLTITNKILQYLNAGLAVIASDTAGQREVLAQAPNAGVIVDLRDTAQTARALDALLTDRALLTGSQRAARQLAENVYCWEKEEAKLTATVATAVGSSLSAR